MTSDEQMYCTGGYMLSKGLMIYRDFSYIAQLPWHPILLAGIYKISATTHYLLAARLFSVICDILIAVCIFSIFRKIFRQYYFEGIFAGLAGSSIFVFNPYSNYLMGLAWNHDLVVLCIVLSFRIFIGIESNDKYNWLRNAAIGSLLIIAMWTRPTSVFVLPIFIAMIIAKTRLKYFWIFLGGAIVFSIVPVWIIVCSGRAFFVNIYTIPTLNSELLHKLGIAYSKFFLTFMAVRNKEFLFLILLAIVVWVYVFVKRRKIVFADKANALLAGMLVIASFVIAYFPPTMWKQYLGIPVVFVIISLACGLFYSLKCTKIWIYGFIALAIFTAAKQNPFSKIAKIADFQKWTPMKVHKISKNIVGDKILRPKWTSCGRFAQNDKKPILTLTPLYAIEGGGKIYRRLSAGAFAFRVAGKLSEEDQKITHAAGLGEMRKMIEENQPAAIVIGPELTRFEKIDLRSLVPEEWQKVNFENVHCFFPPEY